MYACVGHVKDLFPKAVCNITRGKNTSAAIS